MAKPYFDRSSLTFGARRLTRNIQLSARFKAPKLSTGQPGHYLAQITVDPKTRAVIGSSFSYSRDGSKYLAHHGRGKDELRQFAYQIGDMFLKSPAWTELKDRGPDPNYIVDHLGKLRSTPRKAPLSPLAPSSHPHYSHNDDDITR